MNTIDNIKEYLTSYIHIYERTSFDSRSIAFLSDGTIGLGNDGLEQTWEVIKDNSEYVLKVYGCIGLTFSAFLQPDNSWHGKWHISEQMPIKIIPTDKQPIVTIDPWIFDKDFNKDDFSIIIQGPLDPISLININTYLKFAKKVIISHWDYDKNKLLLKPLRQNNNIEIVESKHHNERQVFSMFKGLERSNTKYSIKIRSDEYYTDLSTFINKVLLYPEKMVTNNILFFRRTFHPSDHVISSTTESLLQMCKVFLANEYKHKLPIDYCIETRMALSFLKHKAVEATLEDHDKIFRRYFDVVPVSKMGDFIWTSNQKGIHSSEDDVNMTSALGWGYSISNLDHL